MRFSLHSIFFKTTLIFGFLLLLLSAGAWVLHEVEQKQGHEEVLRHLKPVLFSIRQQANSRLDSAVILEQISQFGFQKVTQEKAAEVLKNGVSFREILKKRKDDRDEPHDHHPPHEHFPPPPPFEEQKVEDQRFFELLVLENDFFLVINEKDMEGIEGGNALSPKVVYHYETQRESLPIGLIFIIVVLLVSVVYFSILKSLLPARELLDGIHRFSKGETDVNLRSDRKDEIAEIANAFDQAVRHVHELTESRRLFVRNIMHELKTPIASGKVALSMMGDSKYKERLKLIFAREEKLLDEFFRVESIASGKLELKRANYNLVDVIDAAKDLLFDGSQSVLVDIQDAPEAYLDFSLFSIALKNLLENGIRYSVDQKVRLFLEGSYVRIENSGESLPYSLEHYAIPYMLKGEKERESRGFGFGLYLTWHICRLHGYALTYQYDSQYKRSIFLIHLERSPQA